MIKCGHLEFSNFLCFCSLLIPLESMKFSFYCRHIFFRVVCIISWAIKAMSWLNWRKIYKLSSICWSRMKTNSSRYRAAKKLIYLFHLLNCSFHYFSHTPKTIYHIYWKWCWLYITIGEKLCWNVWSILFETFIFAY